MGIVKPIDTAPGRWYIQTKTQVFKLAESWPSKDVYCLAENLVTLGQQLKLKAQAIQRMEDQEIE